MMNASPRSLRSCVGWNDKAETHVKDTALQVLKCGLAAVAVLLLFASCGLAQDDPQAENLNKFMRAKLTHSQNVLEGLATEDFDLITKNSQELSLLSRAADWQVLQTAEYARFSSEFRRAADELTESARNKNLDGATLSYVKMTMKCVECHKYVNNIGEARLPDLDFSSDFAARLLK